MAGDAVELFYSYAHEDGALRTQLAEHLASLKREGIISAWHDQEISAGSDRSQEIRMHLGRARIILLLVSSSFINSDYCYGVEMQDAMRRHDAGDAIVIPVILRPCAWERTPFGKLKALPKDGLPVTKWPDRDEAFTSIVKDIRKVVEELAHKHIPATPNKTKRAKSGEDVVNKHMLSAPTLSTPVLKKTVDHYYKELADYKSKAASELSLRTAFHNLLATTARSVKWTLVAEETIEKGIRPDGIVRDDYFRRGCWEAKGPGSNLKREIEKKINAGYPLANTIFENTEQAVLYQNKKRHSEYDLSKPSEVSDLIRQFFGYTEPDIENFETAIQEFKQRIPEHARRVLEIIEEEYKVNRQFVTAFDAFTELCRTSLDPKITTDVIKEMLIQHLLTERLFRTIFDNTDFTQRNVIASEIEQVIAKLTSRSFNRKDFLKSLDRFYVAIEAAAKNIESWSERQHFLNTVYERFFQGYAVKRADTYGIVYTPQEIVDFMCASVDEILKRDFGTSISHPGVKILDPATGTGSFIVNLLHRIEPYNLEHKYKHDLFCNEIMLLPYYIASLNIEHEYYDKMGEYEPFEGVCFVDTLELAEGKQLPLFVEENTARVQAEKDAEIMVVIGNPPYNVGQVNENDNNKNRKYPVIDGRIRETYVKYSKATNRNALSDAYVKFFRWATDRLQGRDGIVCFVSNNSFFESFAFDGFRKELVEEFSQIYHIDLGGNARKQGGGNVFGIMVGVGITILIRRYNSTGAQGKTADIFYYKVDDSLNRIAKLAFLQSIDNISNFKWQKLHPDERFTWITENLHSEFETFISIGSKESKASVESLIKTIFRTYTNGVKTNRDNWVYDFNEAFLVQKIMRFIEMYNSEVDKWVRMGQPEDIDGFVRYDDTQIKWSRDLKSDLKRKRYAQFQQAKIRRSLYRPYTKKYYFFDAILSQDIFLHPKFFPNPITENENVAIIISDVGYRASFSTLATNVIPDLHLIASVDAYQCFPFYTYNEDGTNRRENITDWSLTQFQTKHGPNVTKWDIFHYVYAMLHHPQYRERYVENLKRDLPHIPLLVRGGGEFTTFTSIGRQLMDLHLNYEQVAEYKGLEKLTTPGVPFSWRVEKMRLSTDKRVVVVNESLRLGPVPPECFAYRLGNRSALEWVIDQYQVSTDARSGIESDPNRLDDKGYIIRLVGQVVTVSVETVRLVNELAQAVRMEDWMDG